MREGSVETVCEDVDWIRLAVDRIHLHTTMELWISKTTANFVISFRSSKMIMLRSVSYENLNIKILSAGPCERSNYQKHFINYIIIIKVIWVWSDVLSAIKTLMLGLALWTCRYTPNFGMNILPKPSGLKIVAVSSFETFVWVYKSTRRYNSKYQRRQFIFREDLTGTVTQF